MNIIEVKNLKKSYGKLEAVSGISFAIEPGEIFGLLGPNGAGKTTTLEMLEGVKSPDEGTVKILDLDVRDSLKQLRQQVGIVLQSSNFFQDLTLQELLELFASFYPHVAGLDALITKFNLETLLSRKYQELSGGQRQRFVLAMALLHKPKVLFLDEPTIGLDPQVRQNFWEIILELRQEGLTILLTTHYMEEAAIVCDRVAIIDHGRIIACDRPVKLVGSVGIASLIKFMSSKPINLAELEALGGVQTARRDRYTYELETENPEISLRELLEWEKAYSGKIFNLEVSQATLEDVFIKLTGRSLRE